MMYSKLVRDMIPSIIETEGRLPKFHVADDVEYWETLRDKLGEEVAEFLEAENIEELADVLEVIEAICAFKRFDRKILEEVKSKKKEERGGFEGRVVLESL